MQISFLLRVSTPSNDHAVDGKNVLQKWKQVSNPASKATSVLEGLETPTLKISMNNAVVSFQFF